MKPSCRSTTASVVGLVTLATLVSLGALGQPAGAVMGVGYANSPQGLRWTGPGDEDTTGWIGSLTRAAKWMRGTPHLPHTLAVAAILPGAEAFRLPIVAGAWPARKQGRLSHRGVCLLPHLIDLPPPVQG